MTTHAGDEDRELRPVDRYEWTQILRRMRLTGVVGGSGQVGRTGRQTRGGVSAATFKAVAMMWASYGDPDGGNIRPGDASVAVDCEVGIKLVKTVKAAMLALGLIRRVRAGTRATGWADVYELTLPSDLMDVVDVLSPAQYDLAAERLREQARRKPRTGSGGPRTRDDVQGPVDPVQEMPAARVRGPADAVDAPSPQGCTGSGSAVIETRTGSGGPDVRGPADSSTHQDPTTKTTHHSRTDLREDIAASRARGPSQDPLSVDVWQALRSRADGSAVREWGAPPDPAEAARTRRGADLARRVLAGEVRPDELPDLADDHEAVVLPFRTRSA